MTSVNARIIKIYFLLFRYSNHTKDSCFSVGLQKVSPEDVDKVKDIITNTFQQVESLVPLKSFSTVWVNVVSHYCSEGFSETRVKAVLHQIEMGLKHQSSNFGLSLMLVSFCTMLVLSSNCTCMSTLIYMYMIVHKHVHAHVYFQYTIIHV